MENTLRSVERPGSHSASPAPQEREPAKAASGRYVLGEEIARSATRVVVQAFDSLLQRPVALKILHSSLATDPDARHRFIQNAKATAELDHPGIVPVHEVGDLPDGRPFVAMKLLVGKNLTRVLEDVGDRAAVRLTFKSLLRSFLRVCETVAFAHARGVIHRDLRPHNVLLGEFGETYVLDWGLFKWNPSQHLLRESLGVSGEVLRRRVKAPAKKSGARAEASSPELMRLAANLPFMSPEQVNAGGLDTRSDVYGLGTILYAIACGEPPVETAPDEPLAELLVRVQSIPRPLAGARLADGERAWPWLVPPAIEAICARALSMEREARYPTALALGAEIAAYLESASASASTSLKVGASERRAAVESVNRAMFACESAQAALVELARKLPPWDESPRKQEWRELSARLEGLRVDEAQRFADAVHQLEGELAVHHDTALERELCELYFSRYEQARARRDRPLSAYLRAKVLQHDSGRSFAQAIDGVGMVSIRARTGGRIQLHRYVERDVRLTTELVSEGSGALTVQALTPGPYLISASQARIPLAVEPGSHMTIVLREVTPAPGFVHVEEGAFQAGGDALSVAGLPLALVQLRSFEIASYPVTNEAYLGWLRSLPWPSRARHAPRRVPQGPPLWDIDEPRLPDDPMFAPRAPVVGISAHDAAQYCADHGWRLPSELEWEKAGRGVDGRLFPWGDGFDPTFCKMCDSRPVATPESVGSFAMDESPYGVRDMAGGVRDWTASEAPGGVQVVRGGAWNLAAYHCRLTHRDGLRADEVANNLGFRAARHVK